LPPYLICFQQKKGPISLDKYDKENVRRVTACFGIEPEWFCGNVSKTHKSNKVSQKGNPDGEHSIFVKRNETNLV